MVRATPIDTIANFMSESELTAIGSMMPDIEGLSEEQRLKRAHKIWLTMPQDLKTLSRRPYRPLPGLTIRSRNPDPNLLMFIIGNHWRSSSNEWDWDGGLTDRTFTVLQGGHALTALAIAKEVRAGRLPRQ